MNVLRTALPLWIVLALLGPRVATAFDRTPPPPGPTPHRAPKAHPGVHKAPKFHPPKPTNPSNPKNPGFKKPVPKYPGKHPGGVHPSPSPKKGIGKPWWGPMTKPGFWKDQPWHGHHPHYPHHPDPHRDPDWHPDLDPHRDPDWHPDHDPHRDPDWHPRPMPVDPEFEHDWSESDAPESPLELLNEMGRTIRCRVNGKPMSLRPGTVVPLPPGRPWLIEFRRGGGFGVARYELAHGIHKFVRTGHGCDLVPIEPEPFIGDPHAGMAENPLY